MSEGDPSLEDISPLNAAPQPEENVFLPKQSTTPIFSGTPLRLIKPKKRDDARETVAFLDEAQKDSAYNTGKPPRKKQNGFFEMEEDQSQRQELQAMSVLSMYPDNMSQEMNTDRDNASEASTRLAGEVGRRNGDTGAEFIDMESQAVEDVPKRMLLPDVTGARRFGNHVNLPIPDEKKNLSLYFNDGERSVDFVLVWETNSKQAETPISKHKREVFEENLMAEGLELERESPAHVHGLNFIKMHAPLELLRRYCEILKLRMPMKEELCQIQKDSRQSAILNAALFISKLPALQKVKSKTSHFMDNINHAWDRVTSDIKVDTRQFPERSKCFTAVYSRDREYLFNISKPGFWTSSVRSKIVQFVLDRQRFSKDNSDDFAFGIERLINEGAYSAAYPLHDGDLHTPGTMRYQLYSEWASVSKCIHYQPLDYVKEYFGVKIGLYFAWLGFYTHMLLPASIVGLACFIYSAATLYSNVPSEDVCNDNSPIKMCPLCDYWCDYWELKETCIHSRVTYLIDNPTTVFFAIFMSFWAALFLEMWKRYSAEITHRWDLTGFDTHEEHPRPQYLARLAHVKRKQVNVVTQTLEPHVPFWRMRLPATVLSFSVVMLLISLAFASVLGVVLYRMSLLAALSVSGESVITGYAILFTTATAATINLGLICVFNYMYQFLAEWLTEKELLRTQTEFDDSLTLKIYLLQFVNYYASIFYIAFFKGKFAGRPGEYSRFFGFRQEECGPGGCLMELCIQLAIIMIGKQAVNTIVEMMYPYLLKWYNLVRTIGRKRLGLKSNLQWVKDFKLVDFGHMGLFPEYLEMVLQYGFVTIFVAAFPLAPLFALLNNVLEMRLDALKMLKCYRRPVAQRVRDIGVWFRILDSIGKLSVITNGFIIAFTSEFIPRMVYRLSISQDGTLNGYVNHTMAYFSTRDFENNSAPHETTYNLTECRYPDYREHYGQRHQYERTAVFWHVLAARLAFVVVFENVVALVMIMVKWMIPDMSGELRDRIRREAYVINEIIIGREAIRAGAQHALQRALRLEDEGQGDGGNEQGGTWNELLSTTLSGSDFDLAMHAHSPSSGQNSDTAAVGPSPVITAEICGDSRSRRGTSPPAPV